MSNETEGKHGERNCNYLLFSQREAGAADGISQTGAETKTSVTAGNYRLHV